MASTGESAILWKTDIPESVPELEFKEKEFVRNHRWTVPYLPRRAQMLDYS